jgi:hypothetical protein
MPPTAHDLGHVGGLPPQLAVQRNGGDGYGDAAAPEVGQGDGGLAGRALLDGPGFGGADGKVAAEERDVFCQVEMAIDDGQVLGCGRGQADSFNSVQ